MADSSYRRYGIKADNPMMGLVAGQRAMTDSFNQALSGVGDLLKQQEAKAIDTNTVNMQEYLQNKIAKQGLGADPTDMIGIRKKFGNQINMDALQQTDKEGRNQLMKNAIDNANTTALDAYKAGGDMAAAGDVFRQSIIDAGGTTTDADEKTAAFRATNAFRDVDAKNALQDKQNVMLTDLSQLYAGGADDSAINQYVIDNFDEKDRAAAKRLAKKDYNELSALDPTDLQEQAELRQRLGSAQQIAQTKYDATIGDLQGRLDAIDGVSADTKSAVDTTLSRLGGEDEFNTSGEFKEGWLTSVANSVLGGIFDKETGKDAEQFIETSVNDLVNKEGLSRKEALAAALQAYKSQRVVGADGVIGAGIDPSAYNNQIQGIVRNVKDRRDLTSQLAAAQNRKSLGMAELMKRNNTLERNFRQQLQSENRGTGTFDRNSYFSDKLYTPPADAGGGGNASTANPSATNTPEAPAQSSFQQVMTSDTGGAGGKVAEGDQQALNNILNAGASTTATGEGTVPGIGFNTPSSKVNPPKEEIPAKDIDINSYNPADDKMSDGQTFIFNKYQAEINDPDTSSRRKKYLTSWLQKDIAKHRDKVAKEEKRIRDQIAKWSKANSKE